MTHNPWRMTHSKNMRKKILIGLGAAGTALAMLPLFAAFEAHVINVTATIENALGVNTNSIDFGTVFPEEHLLQKLIISLSDSFQREGRVDDVTYVIKEKPKCEAIDSVTNGPQFVPVDPITHQCPSGYQPMPLLCPYLSKEKQFDDVSLPTDVPPFDTGVPALHGDPDNWNPEDPATQASGVLTKLGQDIEDRWDIDLLVPCFVGSCAQDNVIPPKYQLDSELESDLFGCDLWVEVTGVSTEVTVVNSDDFTLDGTTFSPAIASPVTASTTTYYSVRTKSSLGSSIPTVQWKVTVEGPGGLAVGDVHIDEVGWQDPDEISATVFHYPMSLVGGKLVAKGSCAASDPEHGDACAVDDFDVDPLDDFLNIDSVHFSAGAPAGTYTIKRQLVDTETGDPLSNELTVAVVVKP
ncbi:MAG: hypothetical protein HY473_01005 [Candidatus Sungbacteria bacterium]|uniref:Uncharacterized protein n=1 Tax=Candidatus Sungiibacteriota bacterium TaxID=2750080 RepID=A0A932YZ64_9BACT|nr:hypothetical protein [Candidatus Sungbacteria bacterium]